MCSMNKILINISILLLYFFLASNSYATRHILTEFMPQTLWVYEDIGTDQLRALPQEFTEEQKHERKIFLDKVEVVMKFYKIRYHRDSDNQLFTFSPTSEERKNIILEKVNDKEFLEENGY